MANFMSDSDANTVLGGFAEAIKTKEPLVFKGTQAEWNALTEEEKSKFELVCLTDDSATGETVDAVTDGDMRAVTSNAVYDAIKAESTPSGYKRATPDTDYLDSNSYLSYITVGKICFFYASIKFKNIPTTKTTLFTNIPKSWVPYYCNLFGNSGDTGAVVCTSTVYSAIQTWSTMSGNVETNTEYRFSGSYLIDDR